MRHRAVVVASLVVACVAWFGLRIEFDNPAAPLHRDEPSNNALPIASAEGAPPITIIDEAPTESVAQQATTVAAEEELVTDFGARIYARFKGPFVQFLVNRGLSTQDSERVIGEAFRGAARCWFTAERAQAQAEGRSFDPAFELASGALSDSRMLNQPSASCINSALERVGVNPPMGIKADDA